MTTSNNPEKILEIISSQIDLLTTLSVGICAGIVALFIQIAIHNRSGEVSKLRLKWKDLLLAAFVFEGLALVFGYLTYGAITDAAPAILSLTLDANKTWVDHPFQNASLIRFLAIAQFVFFFAGIICVLACLLKNRKLLD